jgi:hypothetical protein
MYLKKRNEEENKFLQLRFQNTLTPKGLREPKRPFLILGRLPYVPKVVGVF